MSTDITYELPKASRIDRCTFCGGAGRLANPLWARYFEETKAEVDEDAWAQAQGFRNAKAMGPEEEWCFECESSGFHAEEVDLLDALRALGIIEAIKGKHLDTVLPEASAPARQGRL